MLFKSSSILLLIFRLISGEVCYLCSRTVVIESTQKRIIKYSRDEFYQGRRFFSPLAVNKFYDVGTDSLCSSMCSQDQTCKSFNFNPTGFVCELTMTDFSLNSESAGDVKALSWMHRSTNTDRSRGCESFPLNENCTWVIVSDVTIDMMIVDWHLPSDSSDNFNQPTVYPQDRQEVKLTYEKHRGQREDFPAGEILQVFTDTTQRRHVFTPLIQGMLFSVTASIYFKNRLSQNVMSTSDSTFPARPVLGEVTSTEYTILIEWSLEGAADFIYLEISPKEGNCVGCTVDVKTKFFKFTSLTAGKNFQFFITAHSHGKNSSVLSLERPTYTDTKTYSLINTIDEPTEIRIVWNTLSGTGSQHKVLLKADRILPTRKTDLFSLNREWIFPDVVEGDQYTIDIEAISQGSDPIVREYHYTLIAFPSTPIPIDNQLSSTKNSISMGFESRGVRHKWYINNLMRCCPITISPEEWQHTSTELTCGTYYEFSVQGQVTFDGETKRGGPLIFRYDTQPDPPTVETLGDPPDVKRKWSLSTAEHSEIQEGDCCPLSNAIDSQYNTHYKQCYHAVDRANTMTYAMFWVEPSYLDSVRLLNRGDACPERMTGTKVFMCNNAGEDCMFCGEVTGAVGAGEWTKVCCEVWAYGSKLRLENHQFPLTVCEVEAYGPYEKPHKNHWFNKIWVHLTSPGGGSKYIFEKLSDSGDPTGEITEKDFDDDAEVYLKGLKQNTLYRYSVFVKTGYMGFESSKVYFEQRTRKTVCKLRP